MSVWQGGGGGGLFGEKVAQTCVFMSQRVETCKQTARGLHRLVWKLPAVVTFLITSTREAALQVSAKRSLFELD